MTRRWRLWAVLGSLLLLVSGCRVEASARPVTLALLGDVMLGRGVQADEGSFAYLQPHLVTADLALANLESPLTDAPAESASPYILCAPPKAVEALAAAGIDLLSVANNHSRDCGAEGAAETLSVLQEAGLGAIGQEGKPLLREVNELHLAFLAFDATGDFAFIPAVESVRSAREGGAVVIVSMHWGAEYQSSPSEEQQRIARQLAEAGAALIWGHHPHVLQPAQWIGDTLVLYSLGNALFDQHGLASTRQSVLALVTLDATGVRGLEVVPFLVDAVRSRTEAPSAEEAQRIMEYFGPGNWPLPGGNGG